MEADLPGLSWLFALHTKTLGPFFRHCHCGYWFTTGVVQFYLLFIRSHSQNFITPSHGTLSMSNTNFTTPSFKGQEISEGNYRVFNFKTRRLCYRLSQKNCLKICFFLLLESVLQSRRIQSMSTKKVMCGSCHFDRASNDQFSVKFWISEYSKFDTKFVIWRSVKMTWSGHH